MMKKVMFTVMVATMCIPGEVFNCMGKGGGLINNSGSQGK